MDTPEFIIVRLHPHFFALGVLQGVYPFFCPTYPTLLLQDSYDIPALEILPFVI